ncbi:MAG: hypothetical protein QM790_03430 [Nibricoccus sp.]
MPFIDKYSFEKKGGCGCSNSDYHLARTTCCCAYGVEDDELLDFYFDPRDLSRVIFLGKEEEPCPFCGVKDWNLERVEDFAAMPQEWRWAVPQDLSQ